MEVEINFVEMQKQRKEEILKSGVYGLLEVVVGENEKAPIAHMEIRKLNALDKAKIILSIETLLVNFIIKEPEAYKIAKELGTKAEFLNTEELIDKNKNEEEE